ncbi:MAG TPA: 30S ribosomal protein S4 [candidate division WWE3 bacterium]|uniref:Small ribosomal subunit protein uS4 n=1 Tax=candidate division WWE3 bacterium TaxID=2053526 RepID=A0A7V5J2E7_UNCKA|nr:30S ribosomal protein S4 [candidate division WWE3 bacterium]
MGRYTGPKGKLARREGTELYLKGAKTYSAKNPLTKRPQPPGQHGLSRKRLSEYGLQLREKQKVKRMYGVYERQFKNYYKKALSKKGLTGSELLSLLERRLDNVLFRAGIADTRAQARQWIGQGKFLLNGRMVRTPSIQVKAGDVISPVEGFPVSQLPDFEEPAWLKWNKTKKEIQIKALPSREDITEDIKEHLIVEFYSR